MLSAMSLATNESVNQSPARSSPTRACLLVLQGVFALVAVSMPSAARAQDLARDEDCCGGLHAKSDLVFSCHPSMRSRINSVLQGGPLLVEAAADEPTALFNPWPFFTVQYTGSSANRIDIVFVGDGFQTAQLGSYASLVQQRWNTLIEREPWVSYKGYFNVHRVDVTSIDAGVDQDPSQGILRNTALDMGFWCAGIDRLLCVDPSKAVAAANCAPDWDQILAVANSTTYGGAGYPSNDLCTFSGFNADSLEVAVHEFGHSFGDLADEYDYADGATYSGSEVGEVNVSIQTQAQMQTANNKWAAWLGVSLPTVGVHGAFEGARYFQFGIRRPTSNSLMRSLGTPFNGPSLEQMIVKIHQQTTMVDAATRPFNSIVVRRAVIGTTLVNPSLHSLSKQWYRAGVLIPGATGVSFDTTNLAAAPAGTQLQLVVTDPTTKVRNETLRTQWLRETYSWTIVPEACSADLNIDGFVNGADLAVLLAAWGMNAIAAGRADVSGNGLVGGEDIAAMLAQWGSCNQ